MARPKLTLHDMQMLVEDANKRMAPMYDYWRFLEGLFRTGAHRPVRSTDLQPWVPLVNDQMLERVNKVLGHISIMVANCVSRDPGLLVEAVGSGAVPLTIADDGSLLGSEDLELNSKFAQATLSYFWKRGRSTDVLRDATEDMVKLGNGFLTGGWAFVAKPARRDNTAEVLDAVDAFVADGQDYLTDELDDLDAHFPLTSELVEVDEPYSEYVSPFDMLLPATCRRIESAPWITRRMVQPVSLLQAVEEFSHTDTITADSQALSTTNAAEDDRSGADTSGVFQYATVYQFWNMVERRLVVFQLGAEHPLYDGPIPYLTKLCPFTHLRYHNDGGNTFWAFGALENMVGPQLMLNELVTAQFKDLKRAGNKYFMQKKLMTPEVRKALESDVADQIIGLDGPANMNLNDVLRPVQRLATPGDTYQMEGKVNEYLREVPGLSDFQTGQNGSDRMAATAVAAVEGSTSLRAQDAISAVENGAGRHGEFLLALCQQFLDSDRAVRIAGPGGAGWLNLKPSDIYGEFRVRTEGGSTKAVNPATLAQRGQTVANVIIPMLQAIADQPALWPAARQAIRDMGLDADHLMSGLKPAEDPTDPTPPEPTPPGASPEPPVPAEAQAAGLSPAEMSALEQMSAQPSAPNDAPVHPADALSTLGAPPVPAATSGGIAL